jgi:preprotein translocase subunit YajC
MTISTSKLTVGAAVLAFALPGAALAQAAPAAQPPAAGATAPTLAQGATVYDAQGGTVGTIDSVSGDYAVVATTKSKVRLPTSSFAMLAKGPTIAMTAAQLDAAAAQAAPAASAKPNIAPGVAVVDAQGGAVGTITDVGPQFATVQLTTGSKVRLPVTAFGAGASGNLRIAMTAAQLTAAAGAATPATPATPSAGDATTPSSSGG